MKNKVIGLSKDWTLPEQWREWALEWGLLKEKIDYLEGRFRIYWNSTIKHAIKLKTWKLPSDWKKEIRKMGIPDEKINIEEKFIEKYWTNPNIAIPPKDENEWEATWKIFCIEEIYWSDKRSI